MYYLTIPKFKIANIFLRSLCSSASSSPAKAGPFYVLQSKISNQELQPDDHQQRVAKELQKLYEEVHKFQPVSTSNSFFTKIFGSPRTTQQPKGLYIYGTVGTGKTLLLDMFFDACTIEKKQRIHFHNFMTNVHKLIHHAKIEYSLQRDPNDTKSTPFDPIKPVAQRISEESWLICFDEFQGRFLFLWGHRVGLEE
jgi:protein AFG1